MDNKATAPFSKTLDFNTGDLAFELCPYIVVSSLRMHDREATINQATAHFSFIAEGSPNQMVCRAFEDLPTVTRAVQVCDATIYCLVAGDLDPWNKAKTRDQKQLYEMLLITRPLPILVDPGNAFDEKSWGFYFALVANKLDTNSSLRDHMVWISRSGLSPLAVPMSVTALAYIRMALGQGYRPDGFARALSLALADTALHNQSKSKQDFWDLSWILRLLDGASLAELSEGLPVWRPPR